MIQAHAYTHPNYLRVVFKYPGVESRQVDLPGNDPEKLINEAKRRLYMLNREYIIKKLSDWLRQRMYAFNLTDRPKCNQEAAKLIVLLGYYERRSFFRLCDLITGNRAAIEALAPHERSNHYPAYVRSILPILEFCQAIKGEEPPC